MNWTIETMRHLETRIGYVRRCLMTQTEECAVDFDRGDTVTVADVDRACRVLDLPMVYPDRWE